MLANLDNEVIFKKAFTDKIVFTAFVKDIVGIDIEVDEIQTEKKFEPKVGHIDFSLNIFAESKDERIITEIQLLEYDHYLDDFSHYISKQQHRSSVYFNKQIYTIVILTAPYEFTSKLREPFKNEAFISRLDPRSVMCSEVLTSKHRLIFLNPYYKNSFRDAQYKDWLDLMCKSNQTRSNIKINYNKATIKRVADLINTYNLTPEDQAERKKREATKITRKLNKHHAREEGIQIGVERVKKQTIINGHKEGLPPALLSKITGLSVDIIQKIISDWQKEQ